MKQKTRLMRQGVCGRTMSSLTWTLVLAAGIGAAVLASSAPQAFALDRYSRGVQARMPPAPLPRAQPAPPKNLTTTVKPSLKSPGLNNSSADFNNRAAGSADCRARCGSTCQTMSCSGLDTSTCLRIRQQCRMSCSTSC